MVCSGGHVRILMKWIESLNLSPRDRRRMVIATRIGLPFGLILLAMLLAAVLVWTGPSVAMNDDLRRAPQVLAFQAQPVPVRRQWQGYGVVEAVQVSDVPARVTSTVLDIPDEIEPGRAVEQGELLIQLDPSDFERRVESAEQALTQIAAQLRQLVVEEAALRERLALEQRDVQLAEAELERIRQVLARGAANQQDLDRAQRSLIEADRRRSQAAEALDLIEPRRGRLEAERSAQQSALRLAQQDLDRSAITAPITGVLQAVDVEEGENVGAGQRVARIVNPDVIEVPMRLPAAARRNIEIGDEAVIQPSNGEGEACFAVVTRMTPENDPGTRTMTAYVTVNQSRFDDDARLTPGAFVNTSVTSGEAQQRWVVPRRSVRAGRILLIDQGVVRSAPVTVDFALEAAVPALGLPDQQWAVLESFPGEPGQLVMVNASQSVLDGQPVEPVLPEPSSAASGPPSDRPGGGP